MISSQRKNQIKKAVIGLLKKSRISTMPVNLTQILDSYDWGFISYKEAQEDGFKIANISDGYTLYHENNYLILFNSEMFPQRIRWTIAHEIGHIVLGHAKTNDISGFTANEEAQYFAEQLLAPAAVVSKLGGNSDLQISEICNISKEAAQWRESDIQRHLWYYGKYGYTEFDKQFLQQFDLWS